MTTHHATRRSAAIRVVIGLVTGLLASGALGQSTWPAKPIRVIANNPAGGAVDIIARVIAPPLAEALGQPVVVENRGGAGGFVGGQAVATAPADGYTLLATAGSMVAIGPHLYKDMPFDPAKALVAVAPAGRATLFLVVRPSVPAQTVEQLIQHLRANPGKLTYGSAGNGSSLHLAGEMFKSEAKVNATHVAYRGAGPAMQDLLGGQIDFMFDSGPGVEHIRSGKLRLVGIANKARSSLFPGTPTLDEAGLKGFDAGSTYGFYAPSGTPQDVISRLNREINRAMTLPVVRDRLAALGAEPTPGSPADLDAVMADDSRRFGAIVRERKIALD